jgi:hypothetical protein
MLTHLDDIIRRLSSFFLVPLVNVLLLSAIVFYCSRNRISLVELIPPINLGDGVQYFLDFLKEKTGTAEIRYDDFVRLFPGFAAFTTGITAFLASASWITFLFLIFLFFFIIYLIDRVIYVIGWLVPIDYEFDDDLYAAANVDDPRLIELYGLIDTVPAFSRLYGIVQAALWSTGFSRDSKERQSILSHIRAADDWFAYMKGYIALLAIGIFPLSLLANLDVWRLALCLTVALSGAALLTMRYAQLHQRLVEHDIDRFLSIELLSRADGKITVITPKPNPDVNALVAMRDERVRALGPVGRLLSKLYLRYQDSGVLFALRFLRFRSGSDATE